MAKIIRVQFSQGDSHMAAKEERRNLYHKEYDYFLVRDEDEAKLKEGSLAVVEVNGCLKIVHVCGILRRSSRATKHAIAVFSLEEHKKLLEEEHQIEDLRAAILARAEEAKEREKLKALAAVDSALAAMLEELNKLEQARR